MSIVVRPVTDDDALAIVAILNPIIDIGCYTIMQQPITVEEQRNFIRSFPERGLFHVAIDSGRSSLVGLQDIMPSAPHEPALAHVGEISTFVAIHEHRTGVGSALTAATLERAGEIGFRKLMARVRADNPGAIAFYRQQGFRAVGMLRGHALVGNRLIDEILLEWLIEPAP